VRRVGSAKEVNVDVRLISATNQNIDEMVKNKEFRLELLFRINIFNINIPPLRDRKEDLPALYEHFAQKHSKRYRKNITGIEKEAMRKLINYNWPGNIRELENVIKSAYASCEDLVIQVNDLPSKMISYTKFKNEDSPDKKLKTLVNKYELLLIKEALKRNNNNIQITASELGIHRSLLYKKVEKYGIIF